MVPSEVIGKIYINEDLRPQIEEVKGRIIEEDDLSFANSNTHIEHDYLFKVIVVGDASVGKTSLLNRL